MSEINIYYSPEKFGLTEVGVLSVDLGYEFDMFVAWTSSSGTASEHYFWAADSGCSCPVPFEDLGLNDLAVGSAFDLAVPIEAWVLQGDEWRLPALRSALWVNTVFAAAGRSLTDLIIKAETTLGE